MIVKEDTNTYRISTLGISEDRFFTERDLVDRLRKRGVWSEDQIQDLISQEVGYRTVTPYGKYS